MAPVKDPKGTLRSERAVVTRNRIAEAARRLFASNGYGATTLAAIAEEAGVAVQTVYFVYASKVGILRALRDGVMRDAEADELYAAALGERSLDRKVELFARSIRIRWEHGHDVVAITEQAAATDPRIKKEVGRALSARRNGIAALARSMALAEPGRTEAIFDALSQPQVYRQLVEVHRWSPAEFETWLARSLKQQVLGRA